MNPYHGPKYSHVTSTYFHPRCAFIPAREGQMMKLLAMVHVTRYTPSAAAIFIVSMAIIFLFYYLEHYTKVTGATVIVLSWPYHNTLKFNIVTASS